MASENCSRNATGLPLRWLVFLCLSKLAFCYSYPLPGGRRYARPVPVSRSAYFPMPPTHHRNEYHLPDYDDEFMVSPQEEFEYSAYDKYPSTPYFGYYPGKDYYRDKTTKSLDGYDYFDDQVPLGADEEILEEVGRGAYPYAQETWFDEELPRYDANAQANAAFMQNAMMAQMYQDKKNQHAFGYDSAADDYDDQHWLYGVPTMEVEENEKVKQYFKEKEDQEVQQLESLTRRKNKTKKMAGKDSPKKQKTFQMVERPMKQKSKMTNDQYFDIQKQIILNSRKNGLLPMTEGLKLAKKQIYEPTDIRNNFWDFQTAGGWPRYLESATNSIKKLNGNKNMKTARDLDMRDRKTETSSTAAVTSTPSPRKSPAAGQKEVVLLRPSNPVRRPFPELSSRSLHDPSVYDTVKKMLYTDDNTERSQISMPQKRFILSEDQLLSELKGLKKV